MTTPAPNRTAAETAGNAVVLIAIAASCAAFVFVTEGAWWVAPPSTERWLWAAGVTAGYLGLCAWAWRGARASADAN